MHAPTLLHVSTVHSAMSGLDEIKRQKTATINEAAKSSDLLLGLALEESKSDDPSQSYRHRIDAVTDKSKPVRAKLEEFLKMKEKVNSQISSAKEKEEEWVRAERAMYRSIQPFSLPSLQGQLEHAISESDSITESLIASFSGDMISELDDFVKNYREERRTYHLRRERLDRWNEERVAVQR